MVKRGVISARQESGTGFSFQPQGPFNLANENSYFGGWLSPADKPDAIVMAFPIEGWCGSAAVVLEQVAGRELRGEVFGPAETVEKAKEQALAALSLDVDAEKWSDVGRKDSLIGELQKKYDYLRPVLFHSPYEAAAAFIIGHRISIKQRQSVMKRMSEEFGAKIEVGGQAFYAFPLPEKLLSLTRYQGLNETKMERLHAVARAAADGFLDRQALRAMPIEQALEKLKELPGVGPFFAQGILHRGAGLVDAVTDDEMSRYVVQRAYKLATLPDSETLRKIAKRWMPFRMWAMVLLHVWVRREAGLPRGNTFTKPE
jgi:DNA-3-methyladenine glycosylase II